MKKDEDSKIIKERKMKMVENNLCVSMN